MAPPRRGSVRFHHGKWLASVPGLAKPSRRVERTFDTEDAAARWRDEQLDRLGRGLEPERTRTKRPTTGRLSAPRRRVPPFEQLAYAWHDEYYEELENGGAGRSHEVRGHLEAHIVPFFATLLDCDLETGRNMVKDWLRTLSGRRPLTPGSPFEPGAVTYARKTAGGLLWELRQILAYARNLGHQVPPYAEGPGIHPLHPLGREQKRQAPLVSVEVTAAIAAELHVVHQSVLWLLRLCGLRISESYGLVVANFFVDAEGDGFIVTEAQGGKSFRVRNDDGTVSVTTRKAGGKTDAATRLIALPAPLTTLLEKLIEVFHMAPDGSIDPTARLIPVIRVDHGGQGGFRSALRAAASHVGGPYGEDSYRVVPHDLRKNFATDLAWSEVSGLVARRAMGHRAGSDVFDLVYTLDTRLKEHLAPVARQIERELADANIASLLIPTTKRPVYGREIDSERVAHFDARLEEMGWQVHDRGDLLSAREAAALLGRHAKVVRRLFPDRIPAVKVAGEWRCKEVDVRAFVERIEGRQLFTEVVEQTTVDYYTVYRTMKRLGIEPTSDGACRGLLLKEADADRIVEELARIQRLQDRAMTVPRAAAALGVTRGVVQKWADAGRLIYDPEVDGNGFRYVTRASVGATRVIRFGRRPRVSLAAFKTLTGFDDAGVAALVKAGLLVRMPRGALSPASVRSWVAGHRPDLVDSPILEGLGG